MAQEETIWYGKKKECGEIFLLRRNRRKIRACEGGGEWRNKRRNMFDHRRGGREQRRKRRKIFGLIGP